MICNIIVVQNSKQTLIELGNGLEECAKNVCVVVKKKSMLKKTKAR